MFLNGVRRTILCVLALLALATPDLLAQRQFPHRLTLDSRSLDTLRTPDPTLPNRRYRVTVSGTYSMWEDTVNSSVDPIWIYSFPDEEWAKPEWRLFPEGYPIYVGDDRLLDAHGFRIDLKPMPKQTIDTVNHRYSTIVQGTGRPLSFTIIDWNFKDFIKTDAHSNNSGTLDVLVEELPLTEWELCAIDSSAFPKIRLSLKVTRDSVRVEDFASNLRLYENGLPVHIDSIDCADRTQAVSVAMLFDRSGSMDEFFGTRTRMELAIDAGKRFVDYLSLGDEAAIFSFSSNYRTDQNWTGDKSLLKGAIDQLEPDGGTAFYDAAYRVLGTSQQRPASFRRAVIILSDGRDNQSALYGGVQASINRARSAGIPVFGIGMAADSLDSLERLAVETGGRFYSVRNPNAIDSVFKSIADIILEKGCCSIYYVSPNPSRDGRFRPVGTVFTYDGDSLPGLATGYTAPQGSGVNNPQSAMVRSIRIAPNPLGTSGTLRLVLPESGLLTVDLIGSDGALVRQIAQERVEAGEQTIPFTAADLPAGRYFLRVRAGGEVALQSVVVVR